MRMDAEDDAATLVEEETREAESKKIQAAASERPDSQGTDSSEAAAPIAATTEYETGQ
jgi:hypothetical protein